MDPDRDYDYNTINRIVPHNCCCGLLKLRTGCYCICILFSLWCLLVIGYYSMTIYLYTIDDDGTLEFEMTYAIILLVIHAVAVLMSLDLLYGVYRRDIGHMKPWIYMIICYILLRFGAAAYMILAHRFLEFFKHCLVGAVSLYCGVMVFAYYWQIKMNDEEDDTRSRRVDGIARVKSDIDGPASKSKKKDIAEVGSSTKLTQVKPIESEVRKPTGWFSGWGTGKDKE